MGAGKEARAARLYLDGFLVPLRQGYPAQVFLVALPNPRNCGPPCLLHNLAWHNLGYLRPPGLARYTGVGLGAFARGMDGLIGF